MLDVRPESSTYRKLYGIELSAENGRMLCVPEHCAHGYWTLEERMEIYHMTSGYYTPNLVCGVRFDDPALGIQGPIAVTTVSEQDRNWSPEERPEGKK